MKAWMLIDGAIALSRQARDVLSGFSQYGTPEVNRIVRLSVNMAEGIKRLK